MRVDFVSCSPKNVSLGRDEGEDESVVRGEFLIGFGLVFASDYRERERMKRTGQREEKRIGGRERKEEKGEISCWPRV